MAKVKTPDATRFAFMIGANMKYLRLNRNVFMPQKVLAHQIGVTFQQVNKYESGKNIPCAYRLVQIADFYKVTPNDLVNPSYIHEQTKANEVLDKRLTPQDAGYLKPQKGIGSMEEITKDQMDAALDKAKAEGYLEPKLIVGSLETIKDQLKKDGIDPEKTVLPSLRRATSDGIN